MSELGIVVIGRNEGERLRRCLNSVSGRGATLVYVDSNSTDDSVALAQSMGVEVVELDLSRPFTAARARNEGFERLLQIAPDTRFVQFVDGDCEIASGWLEQACRVLNEQPDVAVVCGRRRERAPDATFYNRLADLEWDTPIGEAAACGGDAMMRVALFRRVGGYNPTVIAGEEPELCLRMRREGGKILRIDAEMTLHDMAMTQLGQWWKRTVRAGHAYAEGSAMHGRSSERHYVRQTRSIVFWGLVVPLAALSLAWPTRGLSLLLFCGYPLLYTRTYRYYRSQRGWPPAHARLYALSVIVGKFPQALGVLRYWLGRLFGKRSAVIDYRGPVVRKEPVAR